VTTFAKHKRLGTVSKDTALYTKLIRDLIIQGLIKLHEPKVQIIVRKQDLALVESILSSAVEEYKKRSDRTADVTVSKETFLPPGPESTTDEANVCSGGIVLSSNEGKIICANTLDARLSMAFEQKLPEIRTLLFGASETRKHKD